jgi:hypothetical protein
VPCFFYQKGEQNRKEHFMLFDFTRFVRNADGKPTAVMMAVWEEKKSDDGSVEPVSEILIGYSLLNPKDQFSRKIGRTIAAGRAKAYHDKEMLDLPDVVRPEFRNNLRWFIGKIQEKRPEAKLPAWTSTL